jgi:hypothetical protein
MGTASRKTNYRPPEKPYSGYLLVWSFPEMPDGGDARHGHPDLLMTPSLNYQPPGYLLRETSTLHQDSDKKPRLGAANYEIVLFMHYRVAMNL